MPQLTSPPALLPLYVRAAVTAPLHRGGQSLPDSVYMLDDQSIAAGHLTAYERVCGFAVSDVAPATYLHMLAFPLSMALMSERAFPFPLVGMVHVANTITLARPVHADEKVSLQVRAADLRPHAAGQQFDLLAEASVGGEPVWSSRSTYLRRGTPPQDAPKSGRPDRPANDQRAAAAPDGPVSLVRVPDDIGRRYAAVSGDRNPIHLHRLSAKLFGFSAAIAHGMWLKARTLATLEGRLPDAYTVDVAFKLPVLLPTTIAVGARPAGDGWTLEVRSAKSGKPHLAGSVRAAS